MISKELREFLYNLQYTQFARVFNNEDGDLVFRKSGGYVSCFGKETFDELEKLFERVEKVKEYCEEMKDTGFIEDDDDIDGAINVGKAECCKTILKILLEGKE